jgi:hypothetical protein
MKVTIRYFDGCPNRRPRTEGSPTADQVRDGLGTAIS